MTICCRMERIYMEPNVGFAPTLIPEYQSGSSLSRIIRHLWVKMVPDSRNARLSFAYETKVLLLN